MFWHKYSRARKFWHPMHNIHNTQTNGPRGQVCLDGVQEVCLEGGCVLDAEIQFIHCDFNLHLILGG